jgi:hypothetical protein
MTTDNFCFYLQNRLIQTSQTGGQRYSDTSPFSIPWMEPHCHLKPMVANFAFDLYFLASLIKNPQGPYSQLLFLRNLLMVLIS